MGDVFEMKVNRNLLIKIFTGLIILLGVAIFLIVLTNGTKKESEVLVTENKIEIKGQFGTTIELKDVSDIQLIDTIPAVGKQVNGAGLGEIRKGDYNVEGLGTCKLYTQSKEGPFIYIIVGNKYTIMNYKDTSKTTSVYQELKKAFQDHSK